MDILLVGRHLVASPVLIWKNNKLGFWQSGCARVLSGIAVVWLEEVAAVEMANKYENWWCKAWIWVVLKVNVGESKGSVVMNETRQKPLKQAAFPNPLNTYQLARFLENSTPLWYKGINSLQPLKNPLTKKVLLSFVLVGYGYVLNRSLEQLIDSMGRARLLIELSSKWDRRLSTCAGTFTRQLIEQMGQDLFTRLSDESSDSKGNFDSPLI